VYDHDPRRPQFTPHQPWPPQPPQQQYGPAGGPPYPGPAGPPPRKKRHVMRNIFAGIGGLVVFIMIIVIVAAVAGNSGGTPAAGGAAAQASSAAAHTARPAAARTVATFTGSGEENTPRFTVTATWKLAYSFSCAAFGSAGNFAVSEDGDSDFNGLSVNDLAMSKHASTWAYGDAGTHYLEVDSECSWKMKVIDEP
jgi:hypothetical protein